MGAELKSGDWFVLLVRPDCEMCKSLVRVVSNGQVPPGKGDLDELALISVERPVQGTQDHTHSLAGVRTGTYTDPAILLVKTPLGVRLRDGIVLEVLDLSRRL